ncbi:histidinol dehydrogenase [Agathobaculum sp. NTUH-O15-33]|uniref:histidinol dehydrogenase n=1 Tax=Agathobaculum sp. NTUH-O15-33 TaxID=3079302 RepID=UPI002958A6BF|nr:histidinol dehydrogenase [Agathobaculum sp. NTUH-O15-33]WNX86318.1 histidinol dehydrogenase [Agathobaculum sp. NTUH-O15-33]
MFLKTVLADGTAEHAVLREMKARAAGARGDIEQTVRAIMDDVQARGFDAVCEYAEKFDKQKPYLVGRELLERAYDSCEPGLIAALEKAAANIRDYHEQMLAKSWQWQRAPGETLGQTVRGLSRVGLYVPGGTAAYPSSVLMNAIPAKVAGVGELIMVTPPTENMSKEVLAAAKIAGVDTVIAVGGVQAVAALTFGAGFIPQVDKIVGPGNAFVAAAKKLAYGTVDIDMIAGPSEVLVIADHTADPTYVAADLLSQAEHDRLASAVLLTDSMAQAQAISCEMERQGKQMPRWDIIRESVQNYGCAIVFEELADACRVADQVAPEHLEIVTAEPREWLPYLHNAGAIFLGGYAPEPLGDYMAGPCHVLPTSGTARFFSPLSTDTFLKKTSVIEYTRDALAGYANDIIALAEAEHLNAHANSIAVRFQEETEDAES